MQIPIETSARHIHLDQESIKKLFGKNYNLTVRRYLSQPGQFVCEEKLEIVGPKASLKGVSVLGPSRTKSQIEISLTDARKLGINAPIRESGNLEGSPGCKIIGPAGEITLNSGVIVAKRHLHLTPEAAKILKFSNGQIIQIEIGSTERSLIFNDIVVRVSDTFSPAVHIDTDEANAAGIKEVVYWDCIVPTDKIKI